MYLEIDPLCPLNKCLPRSPLHGAAVGHDRVLALLDFLGIHLCFFVGLFVSSFWIFFLPNFGRPVLAGINALEVSKKKS